MIGLFITWNTLPPVLGKQLYLYGESSVQDLINGIGTEPGLVLAAALSQTLCLLGCPVWWQCDSWMDLVKAHFDHLHVKPNAEKGALERQRVCFMREENSSVCLEAKDHFPSVSFYFTYRFYTNVIKDGHYFIYTNESSFYLVLLNY